MKSQNPSIDSTEKIEAEIIKLQEIHDHTSMSLDEEKKLLAPIANWKALRVTAATYAERIMTLECMESEWTQASNKLTRLDDKLSTLNARKSTLGSICHLQAELENNRKINNLAYEKLKELAEKWRTANDIYYQEAKERKEAEIKEAESKEEAEMPAHDPADLFDEEVGYCDQLTAYLANFVAANAKESAVAGAPNKEGPEPLNGGYKCAPTANGPETLPGGYKVLKPRDKNADVLWKVAKKTGSNGKKKGADHKADQQKNQTQAEQKQREQKQGEKKQAEQKLVHSIDNVNAFAKLNIELPMTASKVPATLDAIKACKEHFLAERAKGKEESNEVIQDISKPIDNGDMVSGHATPGTSKGAVTAEVSIGSDQPSEPKETALGKASGVEAHIGVDDQGFPTLEMARHRKSKKKMTYAHHAACSI